MKSRNLDFFYQKLNTKKISFPLSAHLELTYRCNLKCPHCFCKGSENKGNELTTTQIKRLISSLRREGCIWLTLTGGEPLIREDFLDIYVYAREKGFLVTLFTNALGFNKKTIDYLTKSPPYAIEITVNSINKENYEKITRVNGSFSLAMMNIAFLIQRKLPVIIKSNLLKRNKNEIAGIKQWAEKVLGKPGNKHYFKCDPLIYPRLNGDKTPCKYRLSPKEIFAVFKQDQDISSECQDGRFKDAPELPRQRKYLFQCDAGKNKVFIDPFGRLRYCVFFQEYSVNLRDASLKKSFSTINPRVLSQEFNSDSKCQDCALRPVCRWCPARAYLEAGEREKPVRFFCELAKSGVLN
ncbi:MAG: radical SAM protein [Candidatus Omnitrophica bacterium]|nr:radical SAM protein [Candidatus Omnitrophota bacterium]